MELSGLCCHRCSAFRKVCRVTVHIFVQGNQTCGAFLLLKTRPRLSHQEWTRSRVCGYFVSREIIEASLDRLFNLPQQPLVAARSFRGNVKHQHRARNSARPAKGFILGSQKLSFF